MVSTKRKIDPLDLTNSSDHEGDWLLNPTKNKLLRPSISTSSFQRDPGEPPHAVTDPTPPPSSQPFSNQISLSLGRGYQFNPVDGTCLYGRGTGGPGQESQATRNGWSSPAQEIENDSRREIDLTQDSDDDVYSNYELYGILNTKCVGVRYYTGRATIGEYVVIRREPRNPYDSNAIRVDNVVGNQIGHIPKQIAAKLARLMDSKALLVEGALTGRKGEYDVPIGLKLFGSADSVESAALKKQMQELSLPVDEHLRAEAGRKKKKAELGLQRKAAQKGGAALGRRVNDQFENVGVGRYVNVGVPNLREQTESLQKILGNAQIYNPRDVQDVVNKFVQGEEALAALRMAEQPAAISSRLLPYQRQGLRWMLEHESPALPTAESAEVVQLFKNDAGIYTNIATRFSSRVAPVLASGGILADGKSDLIMCSRCLPFKFTETFMETIDWSTWEIRSPKLSATWLHFLSAWSYLAIPLWRGGTIYSAFC